MFVALSQNPGLDCHIMGISRGWHGPVPFRLYGLVGHSLHAGYGSITGLFGSVINVSGLHDCATSKENDWAPRLLKLTAEN